MSAYYNEHDKFAAAWLRELIKRDVIAPGEVDERDIQQVKPRELRKFSQCHFFAGIGVWSYALRQAGWPDAERVWTGSCPCQPFSVSGRRGGASDGRHLWPVWFPLVQECGPGVIFGEQVASDDGLAWLDLVSSDLENANYTVGAVDTCAAGFGAPQISQRLYFVAEAAKQRRGETRRRGRRSAQRSGDGRESYGVEQTAGNGLSQRSGESSNGQNQDAPRAQEQRFDAAGELGAAANGGLQGIRNEDHSERWENSQRLVDVPDGAVRGAWGGADWLYCRDNTYRPVEPGTFPLAHRAPARVGRLRGYGNALVAPQAIAFIKAYLEICSRCGG